MNNRANTVMLILVVVFLLVAAVSVTITVTRENTLKEVANAINSPVNTAGTQAERGSAPSNFAGYTQSANIRTTNQEAAAGIDNAQPYIPANVQGTINSSTVDSSTPNGSALPSCHGTGSTTTGSSGTSSYSARRGGCCGK